MQKYIPTNFTGTKKNPLGQKNKSLFIMILCKNIFPLTLLGQKKIHWDKKSLRQQRGGTAAAKGGYAAAKGETLLFCLFFDLNKTIKKTSDQGLTVSEEYRC